jgi:hypothetical protein
VEHFNNGGKINTLKVFVVELAMGGVEMFLY